MKNVIGLGKSPTLLGDDFYFYFFIFLLLLLFIFAFLVNDFLGGCVLSVFKWEMWPSENFQN